MTHNRKQIFGGYFNSAEEANEKAIEMRSKLFTHHRRKAQSLVEYSLILALVSTSCFYALTNMGQQVKQTYINIVVALMRAIQTDLVGDMISNNISTLSTGTLYGANVGIGNVTVNGIQYGIYLRGGNKDGYAWDFNPSMIQGMDKQQIESLISNGDLVVHFRELNNGIANGATLHNATSLDDANRIIATHQF